MICVDFGSGHNPRKGFLSCDITSNADLYYNTETFEIENFNEKVDLINVRNVVHHLPDIKRTMNSLKKYLTKNGKIVIIEPSKENFKTNLFLDVLWYRGINKREDIEIFNYRDYHKILSDDFCIKKTILSHEKQVTILKLKGERNGRNPNATKRSRV